MDFEGNTIISTDATRCHVNLHLSSKFTQSTAIYFQQTPVLTNRMTRGASHPPNPAWLEFRRWRVQEGVHAIEGWGEGQHPINQRWIFLLKTQLN